LINRDLDTLYILEIGLKPGLRDNDR